MNEPIKILCVDDEKNILKAIQRLFLENNYEILSATSGPEGLEILRKIKPIQVVVSDFRMPGMHGADFLKEVYKDWPETVRILTSGFADLEAVISALNEGHISKFIPKPWHEDAMRTAISGAIKQYAYHRKNKELTEKLLDKETELLKTKNDRIYFQNLFADLPVAAILMDLNGMILQCNRKGKELFGKNGVETIGTHRNDFLPETVNGLIDKLMQTEMLSERCRIGRETLNVTGSWIRSSEAKEEMILVFDPITG